MLFSFVPINNCHHKYNSPAEYLIIKKNILNLPIYNLVCAMRKKNELNHPAKENKRTILLDLYK